MYQQEDQCGVLYRFLFSGLYGTEELKDKKNSSQELDMLLSFQGILSFGYTKFRQIFLYQQFT